MEAAGHKMIITPRFNNWLFESDGEIYVYWSSPLRKKYCRLFGHQKLNFDEWHCDRCFTCIEHKEAECEY